MTDIAPVPRDPILPCHKVKIVCFDVFGPALLNCFFLLWQQLELQCIHDRMANLVLDCENISKVAIVTLGPQMSAAEAINELGRDSNPIADLSNASFQNVADSKLLSDVADI